MYRELCTQRQIKELGPSAALMYTDVYVWLALSMRGPRVVLVFFSSTATQTLTVALNALRLTATRIHPQFLPLQVEPSP